jgi:hypothetical protein
MMRKLDLTQANTKLPTPGVNTDLGKPVINIMAIQKKQLKYKPEYSLTNLTMTLTHSFQDKQHGKH